MSDTPEGKMPDLNKDGKIDEQEMALHTEQARSRRKMAWVALAAVIASVAYLLGWADPVQVKEFADVTDWFYASMATIVCAYMGADALIKRK